MSGEDALVGPGRQHRSYVGPTSGCRIAQTRLRSSVTCPTSRLHPIPSRSSEGVHLYTYLALALSFSHQLATGASFVWPSADPDILDRAVAGNRGHGTRLPPGRAVVALGLSQPPGGRGPPRGAGRQLGSARGTTAASAAALRRAVLPVALPQARDVVARPPILGLSPARSAVSALHSHGASVSRRAHPPRNVRLLVSNDPKESLTCNAPRSSSPPPRSAWSAS